MQAHADADDNDDDDDEPDLHHPPTAFSPTTWFGSSSQTARSARWRLCPPRVCMGWDVWMGAGGAELATFASMSFPWPKHNFWHEVLMLMD